MKIKTYKTTNIYSLCEFIINDRILDYVMERVAGLFKIGNFRIVKGNMFITKSMLIKNNLINASVGIKCCWNEAISNIWVNG